MTRGNRAARLLGPVIDTGRLLGAPGAYARFLRERRRYSELPESEALSWADDYPQLWDRQASSPYDEHYFLQDVWAAQRIAELAPTEHVDVGSRVDLVGFLTAITRVVFVDIRPLETDVPGLTCVSGSVLNLPFDDRSLQSVSCLHVAEHIGLGRYGDPLDPAGTRKAARELARVLAPEGQLLFSLPVGRERVEFNAHRILSPGSALDLFGDLELLEFSGVGDNGNFARYRDPDKLAASDYACGMFRFTRTQDT